MAKTCFFWDELEDNIVEEFDESGVTIADYTTEPDHFGNVISQYRSGQSSFYHYDALGSTLVVTEQSQNVTDTFAYTSFGEVTERIGITEVPFQYIGQKGSYTDALTEQLIARRRWYLPSQGRWTSADPRLAFPPDVNRYTYARNRVLNFIDPSGLVCGAEPEATEEFNKCKGEFSVPMKCAMNKDASTRVAVCARPVRGKPIGCHIYLKVQCGPNPEDSWSFGGVQAPICEQCKDKLSDSQLRLFLGEFRKDSIPPNPDFPRPPDEPGSHVCSYLDVERSPGQIVDCMIAVTRRIRECCIEYDWKALADGDKSCNSNCAASWIAKLCFTPLKGDQKIELPADRPAGCLGWDKEMPDCVSKSK